MTGIGFYLGIACATFAASGYFFLKFWRASRDRFYLLFATASWIIATESLVLQYVRSAQLSVRTTITDDNSWVFLFRLVAFLLILVAIVDKNRGRGGE